MKNTSAQWIKLAVLVAVICGVTGCGRTEVKSATVEDCTTNAVTLSLVTEINCKAESYTLQNIDCDLDNLGAQSTEGECTVSVIYDSLDGLENYPALEHLTIDSSHQITHIDLSNNPNLISVSAPLNNVRSLEISHNEALEFIDIRGNLLQTISFENNPNLLSVDVSNNDFNSETRGYLRDIDWIDELRFGNMVKPFITAGTLVVNSALITYALMHTAGRR